MIDHQILFLRSGTNPKPRWLYAQEKTGYLRLCDNRADGDRYTETAMVAVKNIIPLVWKNKEQREAWMREIPVTMSDEEVSQMITEWQAENPFVAIKSKPAKPKPAPASDDAPASAPAVAPTTAPDADADEWSAE